MVPSRVPLWARRTLWALCMLWALTVLTGWLWGRADSVTFLLTVLAVAGLTASIPRLRDE